MNEPLPGLSVPTGLTDRQLVRLRTLVRAGQHPRVRLLDCAGQVAGQRGSVIAIGQPAGEMAEFIMVRMDRDGDALPFAPHELHLLAGPDVVDEVPQPGAADGNLDRPRSSRTATGWP